MYDFTAKSVCSARIVKTKFGDDYRKWDLKELFNFGPYDKTRIVQTVRQKYRIPWNEPLVLKYRDIDGDWITFETEEEIVR
uniref:Uncharacterized protein n=1 Tax=Ditylenchus dipsaci TaxID=166011 RepID=A0A915D884_9BILA